MEPNIVITKIQGNMYQRDLPDLLIEYQDSVRLVELKAEPGDSAWHIATPIKVVGAGLTPGQWNRLLLSSRTSAFQNRKAALVATEYEIQEDLFICFFVLAGKPAFLVRDWSTLLGVLHEIPTGGAKVFPGPGLCITKYQYKHRSANIPAWPVLESWWLPDWQPSVKVLAQSQVEVHHDAAR